MRTRIAVVSERLASASCIPGHYRLVAAPGIHASLAFAVCVLAFYLPSAGFSNAAEEKPGAGYGRKIERTGQKADGRVLRVERKKLAGGRKTFEQLRDSVDAGDWYMSDRGRRPLHRLAGAMVVRLKDGSGKPAMAAMTGLRGQLDGYLVEYEPGPGMMVLRGAEPEVARQRQDKGAIAELLAGVRSNADVAQADPVFIDPATGLRMIPTRDLIVKLKAGIEPEAYFGAGLPAARQLPGTKDQFVVTAAVATAEELLAVVNKHAADPRVAWAQPDFLSEMVKDYTPNDTYYPDQWHLNNTGQGGGVNDADVDAPEAWNTTRGTNSIVIAIIDDGGQIAHPDLTGSIFSNATETLNGLDDDNNGYVDDVQGWDFMDKDNGPSPDSPEDSHGTAIAGIIAAVGNNALGMAGVAHQCKIMPLKIWKGPAVASDSVKATAIRYAAGLTSPQAWRGADIISISLSFAQGAVIDSALVDATTNGRNGKGCPVFCSTGNDASGYVFEGVQVYAGNWFFEWTYGKNASLSAGEDTCWLAYVQLPDGTSQRFDSPGTPSGWSLSPYGSTPWVIEDRPARAYGTGRYQARAGTITHNQTTDIRSPTFSVASTAVISYYYWVSSEKGADTIAFWAHHSDGAWYEVAADSGIPTVITAIAYPASHSNTIAVGASSDFDYRADYSQYGAGLDFVAPGGGGVTDIHTTDRTGADGYNTNSGTAGNYDESFGGTSASAPLAAGIGALVLSVNPGLTATNVRALMRSSCDKVGGLAYSSGTNMYFGYGRINASNAVRLAMSDLAVTKADSPDPVYAGSNLTYTVLITNKGPARCPDVTVFDTLPAGVTNVVASPSQGTCTTNGNIITFNLGSLNSNSAATVIITVSPTIAGLITNVATVAGTALDPLPADNIATQKTTVNMPQKTMTVVSAPGVAYPGTMTTNWNTTLTQRITNSPVPGGVLTQYICSGWTMTGNAPAAGSGTNVTIILTNNATLTWLWSTNYWLDTGTNGNGAVDVADSWKGAGSNVTVLASPGLHSHFAGWTGDTQGDTNNVQMTVVMAGTRRVTAGFDANLAPLGTPEWWLWAHRLTNATFATEELLDGDGDGMPAWQEFVADTDPTNRESTLSVTAVRLADGQMWIEWRGGRGVTQYIQSRADVSATGQVWSSIYTNATLPTPVTNSIVDANATNPALFYRIRIDRQ
ncbi:MAG: S8 family serine peptidase [bacterium]